MTVSHDDAVVFLAECGASWSRAEAAGRCTCHWRRPTGSPCSKHQSEQRQNVERRQNETWHAVVRL